jgi:lipid A 3-O-deacylase
MAEKYGWLVWVIPLTLLPFSILSAAEGDVRDKKRDQKSIRISIEYLYPTKELRNIRTVNLNAYYLIKESEIINLYAGITATHAKGHITQFEGYLDEGTFREVDFNNEATGMGPGILADLCVWRNNHFSLHFDGSGSLIFYNRDFPAGGDIYNFMLRIGPVLKYVFGEDQNIGLGYQWMHVSNGQGVGPHNPSYDTHGLNLQYTFAF